MSTHDLRSCFWGHAVSFDSRNADGSWRAHIFLSARIKPGDRVLAQGKNGDLRYRVIGEVRTPMDPGDLHFVTLMHEPADRACPHGDLACPCQDGDPCHYEDLPGSLAWPSPLAGPPADDTRSTAQQRTVSEADR